MRLPGIDDAVVGDDKIRDYLLSESHPVGRFKEAFFSSLGYSRERWQMLGRDLRRHANDNESVATEHNSYGQKYEIRGRIEGPSGKVATLVALWIILQGEEFPRFVTAFPGARS
jgi:hypothetical protein